MVFEENHNSVNNHRNFSDLNGRKFKVGCLFLVAISSAFRTGSTEITTISILLHLEFRRNDYREDKLHFTENKKKINDNCTLEKKTLHVNYLNLNMQTKSIFAKCKNIIIFTNESFSI